MVRFEWSERKRLENLARHGFDFVDATRVFGGPTFTFEDDRFDYSERRFVTLGTLDSIIVSMVHTETPSIIRIISMRKATTREQAIFFAQIRD
jgi:uncharacterized protein